MIRVHSLHTRAVAIQSAKHVIGLIIEQSVTIGIGRNNRHSPY